MCIQIPRFQLVLLVLYFGNSFIHYFFPLSSLPLLLPPSPSSTPPLTLPRYPHDPSLSFYPPNSSPPPASPPIPLITKLTAVFGDTVVLPCDGSYYAHQLGTVEVERALGWSTMGEDVLSHQGEGLTAGPGYEGRVFIPPERFVKGNFSLDLQKVGLSDANIYECIWQGRKTISTVWLHVDGETCSFVV